MARVLRVQGPAAPTEFFKSNRHFVAPPHLKGLGGLMASVPDVGKLRPVLDYMPCTTCLDSYTPEQDYYCAICARMNRDVLVERGAPRPDEAVQVVPPAQFEITEELQERIREQELALQEAHEKIEAGKDLKERLGDRERALIEAQGKLRSTELRQDDLQQQLDTLQNELDRLRKEKQELELVPFDLVAVKSPPSDEDEKIVEFVEEPWPETEEAWEEVSEEAVGEAEVPEEAVGAEEAPEFQPGAPEVTPQQRRRVGAKEDAIKRVESEIAEIEAELSRISKERAPTRRGRPRRRRGRR